MEHIWEMPEFQAAHRLEMHSPMLPWSCVNNALQDAAQGPEQRDLSTNNWYKCLDGIWSFYIVTNPDQVENDISLKNWFTSDFNDKEWNNINVPGTWTRQGFDKPHYTNVIMPFENIPPHVPQDENPTGLYRLKFTVPKDWENRRIVLNIGSAESCSLIWVDGTYVGFFKDTRLPSEFDITQFLQNSSCSSNKHTLAIMVIRYSDASFVEDQDQWWFGGIHRSVFLYSTADTWISDVESITNLDGAKGILPLKVTIGTSEILSQNKKRRIKWSLSPIENSIDMTSSSVKQHVAEGVLDITCNYRNNMNQVRKTIVLEHPLIWSHENPNRYVLAVTLLDENREIESRACCVGFRSSRVNKRQLLINDKAVYIKGVNRHEHNEKTGKTLTTEQMVRDIQLLKAYNFNAVRTCHYPNDERWYELCDKYGIYLVDEANIENHCYYDNLCRSETWATVYMTRLQRMVYRDKNHPSVIIWSLGNESGYGSTHDMMYAWCHAYDNTRPVQYEGPTRAEYGQTQPTVETLFRGKTATDIICPMYPEISLINAWAEQAQTANEDRPLIMCEYSHAMGNSNGSLADYWTSIKNHFGLQGGFIWDWIDQGLETFDNKGNKYWRYGGDFGDKPTDYDFCLNGILLPDQTVKPVMDECFKVFQNIDLIPINPEAGIFEVENRFDFTTADIFNLEWSLLSNGVPVQKGVASVPPIKPGEKQTIHLLFAGNSNVGIAVPSELNTELVFHADFIYTKQFGLLKAGTRGAWSECVIRPWALLPSTSKTLSSECSNQSADCKQVADCEQVVACEQVVDCKQVADCEHLKRIFESEILCSPLSPSLFRCPTENDAQKTIPTNHRIGYTWLETSLNLLNYDSTSGTLMAAGKKIGTCQMEWKAVNSPSHKILELTAVYNLEKSLCELPKIGFSARIPTTFSKVSWYGKGPSESYSDRLAGSALGFYEKNCHDMETSYIVPQENGNRSDVRFLELSGINNSTYLRVESDTPFNFSIMHHEAIDLWKCFHTNELTDTSVAVNTSKAMNNSQGKSGYFILNLDIAQRGVGTMTCGPDTLEKYRLFPGVYKAFFRFIF